MQATKAYDPESLWQNFYLNPCSFFPIINNTNVPVRLLCLLGIFIFGELAEGNAQGQQTKISKEKISAQIDDVFSTYYYTHLDSALHHFGAMAEMAKQQQWWRTYLEIVTYMAWCADHHKNIDTLQYFLQLGESIAMRHQVELDTLDSDHISRYDLMYTRGMYYYSTGDFQEAIQTFRQIVMPGGEPVRVDSMLAFDTYSFIGHAYYRLENYEQAMAFHQIATQWLPRITDNYETLYERGYQQALNQFYTGKCHLALAEYGVNAAGFQQAKLLFQKSLDTLMSHPKNIANKNALISHHNALAQVYARQGKYDSSLYFLEKSLRLHLPNDTELLHTYLYLGDVYLRQADYPKALEYYSQRLALAEQKFTGQHYQKAVSLYKIGAVYAHQHQYEDALYYYQQAIGQLVRAFDAKNVLVNPPLQAPGAEKELLEVLLLKAQALHAMHRHSPEKSSYLTGAVDTYHVAVDLVDKMRRKFPSIEYKQFLSAKAVSIYEQALALAWEAYQQGEQPRHYFAEAFFMAEKSKSALLLEAVKNTKAKDFAGIPKAMVNQENDLKRKLAYWEKRLYELGSNDAQAVHIREKIFSLEQAHLAFVAQMEQNYPEYYRLKYDTKVISAEEVQHFLPENTGLISYFYGDSSLFLLGVTHNEQVFHQLNLAGGVPQQLKDIIQSFTQYDINQGNSRAQFTAFHEQSFALYQALVAPVLEKLKDTPEQLIIIPDGPLGYLPFDILITDKKVENTERADYTQLPYLLRDYRMRYEYSATLLKEQDAVKPIEATIAYAGFAPVYGDELLAGNRNIDKALDDYRAGFGNLVHNQAEVSYAKDLFGGISFEGEIATEKAFKQYAGQSKVLHLSMHAFTNDHDPEYSGMVFTPQNTSEEDNFLYVYELYTMRLHADLAILSACETGTGTLARGEGILSLGRAFKYAGCPNVAMSLWKVNDQTTGQIMQTFCKYLKEGMEKDEALRQAKLNFLSDPATRMVAHPHFWAPFVLVGNDEPITAKHSHPYILLYFLLLPLTIAMLWIIRKNRILRSII